MKYIYLFVALFVGASCMAQEQGFPQLSAQTKGFMKNYNPDVLPEDAACRKLADGQVYFSALVKVENAGMAERNLSDLGAKIGTKAKDIWTVQVPASSLVRFTRTGGIKYIELDRPVYPALDAAKRKTRVDSVHRGLNLPMPYTGRGVIMGVIDFGFDYTHPSVYDTNGDKFRIVKVWELGGTGTPPAGYTYGNEITDTNQIKLKGTDNPVQMHGSSVADIAAGSGIGGPATIFANTRGVAFESEMVLVGVRRDTLGNQWRQGTFTDFIDGINYIFTHATTVGKPAVVNISWGSQSGAHDGTSLFNQACNNLSGPGKIVVMSAGNDGNEKLHLKKVFSVADTMVSSFITFSDTVYKRTWIDTWGDPTKSFCARIGLYANGVSGTPTPLMCTDGSSHNYYLLNSNGTDTCYVTMSSSNAEINNGKPHLFLEVYNKGKDSITISFKSNDGTINAWDESYFYGYVHRYSSEFDGLGKPGMVSGDTLSTTSEMGSADSVLLIGAYASRTSWTNINGQSYGYGGETVDRLASFSSIGPMADGRISPDITAPGVGVVAAVTSFDTSYTETGSDNAIVVRSYVHPLTGKKYYYSVFGGTSAAAPVASGIVALLLQIDPTLEPYEVKDLLFTTAITDFATGTIPATGSNFWGHGKINAYGAVKKLLQTTGAYEFAGEKLDCVLYPNPGNGTFWLDYSGSKNENLLISVVDVKGAVLVADRWSVNQGNNHRSLDLNKLSKGIYFVKLSSATGSTTIKLILQ